MILRASWQQKRGLGAELQRIWWKDQMHGNIFCRYSRFFKLKNIKGQHTSRINWTTYDTIGFFGRWVLWDTFFVVVPYTQFPIPCNKDWGIATHLIASIYVDQYPFFHPYMMTTHIHEMTDRNFVLLMLWQKKRMSFTIKHLLTIWFRNCLSFGIEYVIFF